MTQQDSGRPSLESFDASTDRDSGERESSRDTGLPARTPQAPGDKDAETREAAKEAIDRATAPVGHDDGAR